MHSHHGLPLPSHQYLGDDPYTDSVRSSQPSLYPSLVGVDRHHHVVGTSSITGSHDTELSYIPSGYSYHLPAVTEDVVYEGHVPSHYVTPSYAHAASPHMYIQHHPQLTHPHHHLLNHTHLRGGAGGGVGLMPNAELEQPLYVNAKQYHRIIKRREARAKLARYMPTKRAPYMHESRHKHALKRKRGEGGRFLQGDAEEPRVETREENGLLLVGRSAGAVQQPRYRHETGDSEVMSDVSGGDYREYHVDHLVQPGHS